MESFDQVAQALESGDPDAALDLLARTFRERKEYPRLFEARLMKKRRELGLPLIQVDSFDELPPEKRRPYEEAFIEAAGEVGNLFLTDGDIARAWSYFRAIGDTAPVAKAIEQAAPGEGVEAVIEIAYGERVNPKKGFALILGQYGICRAITAFHQYPSKEGREESLGLLVRTLHHELLENLRRVIAQQEGGAPETSSVPELIAGRDWLFADCAYHVDTSHIASVLRFAIDADDRETLGLALELAEYGMRLAPMFHYKGDPPFQDIYRDNAIFLRALLGREVEEAVAHFRKKLADSDPNQDGPIPAQVLVGLLATLGRYDEAIEVSLAHLAELDSSQLSCPTVLQLCQMAGDYSRLMELARGRGDLLGFAAGAIQEKQLTTKTPRHQENH